MMENNKRTTKQVIADQQAINRKLWAKENGRLHHVDANKLIAEFMNHEYRCDAHGNTYNNSWDWLMPVVQKCFEVAEHEDDFFAISGNLPYMDSTYKSVVEFIKEYNDGRSELQALKRILIDEHPDTWREIKNKIQ